MKLDLDGLDGLFRNAPRPPSSPTLRPSSRPVPPRPPLAVVEAVPTTARPRAAAPAAPTSSPPPSTAAAVLESPAPPPAGRAPSATPHTRRRRRLPVVATLATLAAGSAALAILASLGPDKITAAAPAPSARMASPAAAVVPTPAAASLSIPRGPAAPAHLSPPAAPEAIVPPDGDNAEVLLPFRFRFRETRPRSLSSVEAAQLRATFDALVVRCGPDHALELTGHTDGVGSVHANYVVGLLRAQRVRALLLARAPHPIIAASAGSSRPITPNDTPAGQDANRRVTAACATTKGGLR